MKDVKDDGGPAFPRPQAETSQGGNYEQDGMTLRDWFAGQVAAAAMVNAQGITDEVAGEAFPHVARISYKLADAMIEERNKGKGE